MHRFAAKLFLEDFIVDDRDRIALAQAVLHVFRDVEGDTLRHGNSLATIRHRKGIPSASTWSRISKRCTESRRGTIGIDPGNSDVHCLVEA
jgi:hypothetical protein